MAEHQNSTPPGAPTPSSPSVPSSTAKAAGAGEKPGKFPNPPDAFNPDQATLREQWRFAMRQYSRWYSHAWGTAILAGVSFFALGWLIKGGNPLPSRAEDSPPPPPPPPSPAAAAATDAKHR